MIAKIELWALRAIVAFLVLGAIGYYIYHLGAESVQAKWDESEQKRKQAEDDQNAKNMADTIARQARVAAAESAATQAKADLDTYRRTHPVSILSCGVHAKAPSHPADPGKGTNDIPASDGTLPGGVLQPGASTDIGPALDELMAKADAINSAYRVCLATRPGAP